MHYGLFGGSFDPPHICHTLFCLYVLEMTDVDGILWVPCADHPLNKRAVPFEHRLAMSRLAVQHLAPHVEVSDIETRLPRPSYTIQTVEALRRRLPDARLSVLIGSDILAELDQWERIEELRQLADFIVVPRSGATENESELVPALPPLSSTAVREALAAGRPVDQALTPAVRAYIFEHNLYGTGANGPSAGGDEQAR